MRYWAFSVKVFFGECHRTSLIEDKSTLFQVMTWSHQAASHYLSQYWPWSMSPYGVTRPPWVKSSKPSDAPVNYAMFGVKPLSKPVMTCCSLDILEQTSLKLNQNTGIFIFKNERENVVCKISAILRRPQCVDVSTRVATATSLSMSYGYGKIPGWWLAISMGQPWLHNKWLSRLCLGSIQNTMVELLFTAIYDVSFPYV